MESGREDKVGGAPPDLPSSLHHGPNEGPSFFVPRIRKALFFRLSASLVCFDAAHEQIGLAGQKAKSLQGLSRILVEKHGGQVPRTLEELEELPGVGHKTASVVLNQAFGLSAFPVDTHIHRLAMRWGLSDGKSVEKTERDLKRVFPEETWGKVHLQIIYFGREYCPALWHDLDACPICSWAASKQTKDAERRKNKALRIRGTKKDGPSLGP